MNKVPQYDTVAMIIHPLQLSDLRKQIPLSMFLSDLMLKNMTKYFSPIHLFTVKNIFSGQKKVLNVIFIACPLLPDQYIVNEEQAIRQVVTSVNLAEKLGAKIAVLGAFNSIVGNQGEVVSRKVNIAVTSGNTYTAALCIEQINRAIGITRRRIEDMVFLVIGATGDIGSACVRYYSHFAKEIILYARGREKLSTFSEKIRAEGKAKIDCAVDLDVVLPKADVILSATSITSSVIDCPVTKEGVIICDVSVPRNFPEGYCAGPKKGLLIEGGRVKVPFYDDIIQGEFRSLFPRNSIYGCLAEGLVLGFEGRFENFSIGRGRITREKMNEIYVLGQKHGFEPAMFLPPED